MNNPPTIAGVDPILELARVWQTRRLHFTPFADKALCSGSVEPGVLVVGQEWVPGISKPKGTGAGVGLDTLTRGLDYLLSSF